MQTLEALIEGARHLLPQDIAAIPALVLVITALWAWAPAIAAAMKGGL